MTYVQTAAEMNYFIAADTKRGKNYTATLAASAMAGTVFRILGTNTSTSTSQAVTSTPAILTGGELDSGVQHVFFVVVDTPQVNKKFQVVIAVGDLMTDTVVAVYGPDGKIFGAETDDAGYYDFYTSPKITVKGTYMVVIKASEYFDPTYSKYLGVIRFQ